MNPDDNPILLDPEGDGFIAATDADADAGPVARAAEVDLDDDLIDADLGEFDGMIVDDELDDLDEELLDADDEDEDDADDLELTLLQELGIDLDAPDADVDALEFDEIAIGLDDEASEDEVAA